MRQFENKTLVQKLSEDGQSDDLVMSRRHRPDYQIILFMVLLMFLGLIIIYAIGPQRANVLNNAYGSKYSDTYFFAKQSISLLVALVAFSAAAFIPFKFFAKNAKKFIFLALGLCFILAIAGLAHLGVAQETLGATRWFDLGMFGSFQPSEALKFALLLFLAMFLGNRARRNKMNDFKETLLPLAVVYGLAMLIIVVIQNDLGTGIALTGLVMAMLVVGKINMKNIMIIFLSLIVLGVSMIVIAPHRIERITTFLKGDSSTSLSSDDSNYHIEHAKMAIGTGGIFGVGIGNSVEATGYLPEAINDSVFAIIGETFGFIGLIVILGLFGALLMRLLKVMDHLPDMRLKLVLAGVFGWLGSHVILNIASMIGLAPLTGITLPLLSFGGTSMVFIAAALGLAFQLSRHTVFLSNVKETQYENFGSRRGIGRSRHSSGSGFRRN